MLLEEFDLKFVKQKLVKGQAVIDFIVEFPTKDSAKLKEEFQDEFSLVEMRECIEKDHP